MGRVLLFVFILQISLANSQVVFCPKGAEWTSTWRTTIFNNNEVNEKMQYVRDSVMGLDTVKVLTHTKFFYSCNYPYVPQTLIKQKGDTIFFRNNKTQSTWQILYNFGAAPGQKWTTTYLQSNNTGFTYTLTVDSLKLELINGFMLKKLYFKTQYPYYAGIWTFSTFAVERFGQVPLFLFRNSNTGSCDGDGVWRSLCYSDSSFGTVRFSDFDCNFSNHVGLANYLMGSKIEIYPQPCQNDLQLVSESISPSSKIRMVSAAGTEQWLTDRVVIREGHAKINMVDFPGGLYFVEVIDDSKVVCHAKIIKE